MEWKHYTSQRFNVDESNIDVFHEVDPFNGNTISGCIAKSQGQRYGSLMIFEVNDEQVTPQEIITTPKLHYPFKKSDHEEREYVFPDYDFFDVRPKLDGTNIFAYKYVNANGDRFVTYKTRLTPVLKSSKYGNFLGLVREVLEQKPALRRMINEFVLNRYFGLSFELYGYRNKHLIWYDVPIDMKLLFGIDQRNDDIIPPDMFGNGGTEDLITKCIFFFSPAEVDIQITQQNKKELFINVYENLQKVADSKNVVMEDGSISGTEGFVFYTSIKRRYILYKCKPAGIEAIHFVGGTIPYSNIYPTVVNALELGADTFPTHEHISQLLLEEFSELQVLKSHDKISKALNEVKKEYEYKEHVSSVYHSAGCNSSMQKREIMRAISNSFDKKEMKKVYASLLQLNLISE